MHTLKNPISITVDPTPHTASPLSSAGGPRENHLLAALSADAYARLLSHMEPVDMPLGWALYEPNCRLAHIYFPTTAIVSMLYVTESGASTEIGIVGNEGLVGISLFMGGETTPSRAVVQSAGAGYRIKASAVKTEFALGAELQYLALRYTQALITQMAQTAVCNRHHTLDQQLCRWLLLSMDRLPQNDLRMTQELIANMLGVRREGVTAAAGQLQAAGLISYSRGRITILDRPGMERRVCECYAVVKKEFDRLLPYPRFPRLAATHRR
jgi:CRP-like cAMP-binding protein